MTSLGHPLAWRACCQLYSTHKATECDARRILNDQVHDYLTLYPQSRYSVCYPTRQNPSTPRPLAPGKNHVTAISTEIFKYVRIHSNFASRPVWFEKMFLCCFFPKSMKKRLDKQAWSSLSTPLPHPPPPPTAPFLLKNAECGYTRYEKPCAKNAECGYTRYEKPCATRQKTVVGGGGGGGWQERTLGLFVKSFLPAFREKQHRNIFSHHRSACEVWVDSDILENFSRNGGYVVLARSHSIILIMSMVCTALSRHGFLYSCSFTSNMPSYCILCEQLTRQCFFLGTVRERCWV